MRPHDKQTVQRLHQELERGAPLSDKYVLSMLGSVNVMTSAEHAAFVLMGIIAPICAYRPHLTEQLLPHILHPLVALGVENADHVIKWIQFQLQKPKPFDVKSTIVRRWIEQLTTQQELIQRLLDEAIRENDLYMVDDTIERFAPYLHIPIEQVAFQYKWSEHRLAQLREAIMFFDVGVPDAESQVQRTHSAEEIVEKITKLLAEKDEDGSIKFVLFNQEGYWDFRLSYEDANSVFPNLLIDKIQLAWLHEGKIQYIMAPNQIDLSLIEQKTLDLLRKSAS